MCGVVPVAECGAGVPFVLLVHGARSGAAFLVLLVLVAGVSEVLVHLVHLGGLVCVVV